MNDERLTELREKYKDRNLLEELGWGAYANHSGYQSKSNGEFINWLCNAAYRKIKEQPEQKWILCTDRLPDKECFCLVTVNNGEVYTDLSLFRKDGKFIEPGDVIAWIPLPEPYQERRTDNH